MSGRFDGFTLLVNRPERVSKQALRIVFALDFDQPIPVLAE